MYIWYAAAEESSAACFWRIRAAVHRRGFLWESLSVECTEKFTLIAYTKLKCTVRGRVFLQNGQNVLKICLKCIMYYLRKIYINFVIFSKFVLDKSLKGWYIGLARVGGICGFSKARTAMMQEIARKRGNFCGVCPVIGRLNCPWTRLRISLRQ